LLAAIPSVIYGLWAIFVLVLCSDKYLEPWLAQYLGWTGLFEGTPYGIGMLAAESFWQSWWFLLSPPFAARSDSHYGQSREQASW